jgi:hypothetical protein
VQFCAWAKATFSCASSCVVKSCRISEIFTDSSVT